MHHPHFHPAPPSPHSPFTLTPDPHSSPRTLSRFLRVQPALSRRSAHAPPSRPLRRQLLQGTYTCTGTRALPPPPPAPLLAALVPLPPRLCAAALRDDSERRHRLRHHRLASEHHRSNPPPSPSSSLPVPWPHSSPHRALLCAPGITLVIGGAVMYALSEGNFLPAGCGHRGKEVSPERDEEAERLAGPDTTPPDER